MKLKHTEKYWNKLTITLILTIIALTGYITYDTYQTYTDAAGMYLPGAETYIIQAKNNPAPLDTALHEHGHHIWFTKLNESQKNKWTEIHYDPDSPNVTEYGQTQPMEDFAEYIETTSRCYNIKDLARQYPERSKVITKEQLFTSQLI